MSAVLERLREAGPAGLTFEEIVERAGGNRAAIGMELQHLVRSGDIDREGGTYWARKQVQTPAPAGRGGTVHTAGMSSQPTKPAAPREPAMSRTKHCPRCDQVKPESEFRSNGYCKPCGKAYDAARQAKLSGKTLTKEAAHPEPPRAARPPSASTGTLPPRLLLPARPRVAVALEERDDGPVIQLASDPETVIEMLPSQMDEIVAWWKGIKAA